MENISGSPTGLKEYANDPFIADNLLFVLPEFRHDGQRPASFMQKVSSAIVEVVENELLVALSQHGRMQAGSGEASRG